MHLVDTMNLLTVIPAVCHRKMIFVAALRGLMISLLAIKCQSLTSGRTTGRTEQDMRNPRIATDKCGRQGVVSNVCDPDNVITFGQGMLLDCVSLLLFGVHYFTSLCVFNWFMDYVYLELFISWTIRTVV